MIKIPSYFTGFGSKTDGSASLRFSTQEISSDEFALLKDHLNEFGWLIFSVGENSEIDIPKENPVDEDVKTPSQRLRNALYVLYSQKPREASFDEFYRKQMEAFLQAVKNKIE